MPSFTVKDSELLASFFHGMTDEMAGQIWRNAKSTGQTYAALRYKISRNGKLRSAAMTLVLTIDKDDETYALVHTDEYHPRKNGKADMEFVLDWTLVDND